MKNYIHVASVNKNMGYFKRKRSKYFVEMKALSFGVALISLNRLICASNDQKISLWDLNSGKFIKSFVAQKKNFHKKINLYYYKINQNFFFA